MRYIRTGNLSFALLVVSLIGMPSDRAGGMVSNAVAPAPAAEPSGVITDPSAILTISEVPKPGYMSPIRPAPFGTEMVRIVGDPGTRIMFSNGAVGLWNTDARQHYSTDQPWNADGSLLAIDQPGGNPDLLFLDGATYEPRFPRCENYNRRDDRWHPKMPNIRINGDGKLLEWFDVVNCTQVKSWTLPFSVNYIGLTNGNISQDGRYVALGDQNQMFLVDMVANQIGPSAGIAYGGWTPTGFGVTPDARYVWVHYSGDYNRIFDVNPTSLALTPHSEAGAFVCHGTTADGFIYDLGHQDVALNPFDNNEDVMIGQEHCGNVGQVINGQLLGHVVMVRLRDGQITSLTDPTNEAYAYHISARNYERPGWVYVSYYPNQPGLRFNQEIISVKMDGSKAVERWVHHHDNDAGCYRCEVQPVPGPGGFRILFNSVWNINCDEGCGSLAVRQAYIVDGHPGK